MVRCFGTLCLLAVFLSSAEAAPPTRSPVTIAAPGIGEYTRERQAWQETASQLSEIHAEVVSRGTKADLRSFRAVMKRILALRQVRDDAVVAAAGQPTDEFRSAIGNLPTGCPMQVATINPTTQEVTLPSNVLQNLGADDGVVEIDPTDSNTTPQDYVGPPSPLNSVFAINPPNPFVVGPWMQNDPCATPLGEIPVVLPPSENPADAFTGLEGGMQSGENQLNTMIPNNIRQPNYKPVVGLLKKQQNGYALDSTLPFANRDIIFIHGMDPQDGLDGASYATSLLWPQSPGQFYNSGGKWHDFAKNYWQDYINEASAKGAHNRYLIVSWSPAQRLGTAVNAVSNQISDAMNSGVGVQQIGGVPQSVSGFCRPSCIVISHSTGALVADMMLGIGSMESSGSINPANSPFGNLSGISNHVKFHLSSEGAYGGSQFATAAVGVIDLVNPFPQLSSLMPSFCRAFLNQSGCTSLPSLPTAAQINTSMFVDLMPLKSIYWENQYGSHSDVPVMMMASSSEAAEVPPGAMLPLKTMLPGVDDGVLTSESQCANAQSVPVPSGYKADSLLKVADLGQSPLRLYRFYANQVMDPVIGTLRIAKPLFVSNACNPYLASTGMVQPTADPYTGTAIATTYRQPRHCPILLSTMTHTEAVSISPDPARDEDVLINDCPWLYSGDSRIFNDTGRFLDPAISTLPQAQTKGKKIGPIYVNFKILGVMHHVLIFPQLWIWRRTYVLMSGYANTLQMDYVFKYVGR